MKFAEVAENTKKLVAAIETMKSAKAVKANDPRFFIVTDFVRSF